MFGYIRLESSGFFKEHLLTIDGVPIDQEQGYVAEHDGVLEASTFSTDFYEKIIILSPEELLHLFKKFSFSYPFSWEDGFESFHIRDITLSCTDNLFKLIFGFGFQYDNWKQLWSMPEHGKEFISVLHAKHLSDFKYEHWYDDDILNGFAVSFKIQNQSLPIQVELEALLSVLEQVHEQTVTNLSLKAESNAVIVKFNFPDEVKVACEQYLLYFVQFLHDIGIEATAELKEKAESVLFSVIPKNKEEALENIKTALGIYLRLPSNPTLNAVTFSEPNIEVQRLVANIYHLQSQLTLASAVIQQKEQFIQQQQSLIQQQLLSGQILVQSIQDNKDEKEDKESIVGDVVSVKKFDWEFIELDLPTLIRRLKKTFKRNKSN
ncbi:hypothetical protein [Nostoc sp. CMAA1605]|uniref:hypothetical protein n=1 Tax=Nostoc sp. CMAA1605 TaxID=2055159 RepID=UPI001F21B783|nr:hypothetical protein [Nostoc sp. CMAA1605]MCF4968443.1 hypothetical protein [Nostoc sp. CMAA1605]